MNNDVIQKRIAKMGRLCFAESLNCIIMSKYLLLLCQFNFISIIILSSGALFALTMLVYYRNSILRELIHWFAYGVFLFPVDEKGTKKSQQIKCFTQSRRPHPPNLPFLFRLLQLTYFYILFGSIITLTSLGYSDKVV